MNKKFKIILIIVAALIVLGIAGFIILKDIRAKNRPPEMPNVTLFKCHMFKPLTDTDLNEIKEIVKNTVGDKILSIEKGIPLARAKYITDENGQSVDVDVGELVSISLSLLTEDEKIKMMKTLLQEYEIDEKYWDYIYEITDVYKSDYKK